MKQLVEYKKFKDVAADLQKRELWQENVFALGSDNVPLEPEDRSLKLQDVSLFDLIRAFNEVLKRAKPETIGEISGYQFTVVDQMTAVLDIVRARQKVLFVEFFTPDSPRQQIICTFLAMLELIRLRQIRVTQSAPFGDIIITGVEEVAEVPDVGV